MKNINNANSPFNITNRQKWFQPRGYYMHAYNNFDMTMHSHSRIEIMYVTKGEIQIEYQSSEKVEKITVLPNNYVFIDSNIPHKLRVNNIATNIYNIELSLKESMDQSFTIAGVSNKENYVGAFFEQAKSVFVCSDDGIFLQNLLLIQKYIGNDINDLKDSYINHLLCALIILLAKQYKQTKKHISGISYVNTAVNYIYENYNRDITLTDLASICGVSPNYLNILFTKSFGHTVKEYVNKYRITRATLLLSTTNLPVDEIRAQVGYHNKISFHQNFLKHIGKPPKKYRQELRSSNIAKTHAEGGTNTYWNN